MIWLHLRGGASLSRSSSNRTRKITLMCRVSSHIISASLSPFLVYILYTIYCGKATLGSHLCLRLSFRFLARAEGDGAEADLKAGRYEILESVDELFADLDSDQQTPVLTGVCSQLAEAVPPGAQESSQTTQVADAGFLVSLPPYGEVAGRDICRRGCLGDPRGYYSTRGQRLLSRRAWRSRGRTPGSNVASARARSSCQVSK